MTQADKRKISNIHANSIDTKFLRSQIKKFVQLIGGLPLMGAKGYYMKPKNEGDHYRPGPSNYKSHPVNTFKAPRDFFLEDGPSLDEDLNVFMKYLSSNNQYNNIGNALLLRSPVKIHNESEDQALLIIDLDRHSDNPDEDGVLQYKNHIVSEYDMPKTLTIQTRSGFHLYFYISQQDAKEIGVDKLSLVEGIDILLAKSPNSRSHTPVPGTQFKRVDSPTSFHKVTYKLVNSIKIQKLPNSLLEDLKAKGKYTYNIDADIEASIKKHRIFASKNQALDNNVNIEKANAYLGKLITSQTRYGPGFRDTELNKFVFRIAGFGLSEGKVLELTSSFDSHCIDPSFGSDTVHDKVRRGYSDKLEQNDLFKNASSDVAAFEPYKMDDNGNTIIEYDEYSKRVIELTTKHPNVLANSTNGIELLASTTILCDGKFYTSSLLSIDKLYSKAYIELNNSQKTKLKIELSDCAAIINKGSISYNTPLSLTPFNTQKGKVSNPDPEKKRPIFLTDHPIFMQQVNRVDSMYIEMNSDKVLEYKRFNRVASHPFSDEPALSKEDMKRALPMIDKIWKTFAETITDAEEPKEINFLKDWLSNIVKNDPHSNAIVVLKGPSGAGKSAFSTFASLFLPGEHFSSFDSADRMFGRFAELRKLSVIEEAKELLSPSNKKQEDSKYFERLKEASTQSVQKVEIKSGPVIDQRGNINFLLLTNHPIFLNEVLSNRRIVLFNSHKARYSADEMSVIFHDMCSWLLDENMFGMKAMYQYLSTMPTRKKSFDMKTKYHRECEQKSMHMSIEEQERLSSINSSTEESSIDRQRTASVVLRFIANMGFISENISKEFRFNLITPLDKAERLIKERSEFSANTHDMMFLINYYNSLGSSELYLPSKLNLKPSQRTLSSKNRYTRFTKALKNKRSGIGSILNTINVISPKPVTSRIQIWTKADSIYKVQKALLLTTPISDWISRLCFLVSDLNNKDNGDYLIERAHLTKIIRFITDCEDNQKIPSRKECEAVFNATFKPDYPDAVFGEFDVISATKCLEPEEEASVYDDEENNNDDDDDNNEWGDL